MFIRLCVALAILGPFFVIVPGPATWQIFLAALVAFGSGRAVERLVAHRRPPAGPEEPSTSSPSDARRAGLGRSIALGLLLALVPLLMLAALWWKTDARERAAKQAADSRRLEQTREHQARLAKIESPAVLREELEDRTRIDLDGATALVRVPSEWQPLGDGAFARSSGQGPFLTDTLLVQASCVGACGTVHANLDELAKFWSSERAAYRTRWTPQPGALQRRGTDRVALDVELDAPDDDLDAWVHVVVVHPRGARHAAWCEVVVFGEAAARADAAAVCDTLEIAAP